MAVGKSSILRAANAGTKGKASVLVPDIQVEKLIQFMAEESGMQEEKKSKSVSIKEKMPVHLL